MDHFSVERQCPSLRDEVGHILPASDLIEFNFKELKTATANFKNHNFVGEGTFGKMFRGWLRLRRDTNKTTIAIKRLYLSDVHDLEAFRAEIKFFSRLRHPNLVKLLGYCYHDSLIFLVYEYVMRGSLECHLFGRGSRVQPLSWETRMKIALQAARAFSFLVESDDRVLSRDVKPSNILLDEAYNAKIDFCLVQLIIPKLSRNARVHHPYESPEQLNTGNIYIKSDVYSFGLVLMELLTGLRAIDKNISRETMNIDEWAKPFWSNERNLKSIMDSKLGDYPIRAALEIAKLAFKCLAKNPDTRPSMVEVLEKLERIQAIE